MYDSTYRDMVLADGTAGFRMPLPRETAGAFSPANLGADNPDSKGGPRGLLWGRTRDHQRGIDDFVGHATVISGLVTFVAVSFILYIQD